MPKVVKDETKHLIAYLIQQGKSCEEIAQKVNCSTRTVKRIKKEMAPSLGNNGTISKSLKYIDYTNTEPLKLSSRSAREKLLFEDTEEGWIFETTESDERCKAWKRTSGKWWVGIVYPESAPEEWLTRLRSTGMQIAVSPIHDKDKWEHDSPEKEIVDTETGEVIRVAKGMLYKKGDPKKEHLHIIVKTDTRVSWQEINRMIRPITNGPLMQKCNSLKGAYEYFIHLNNPERYQYDRDEIQTFNDYCNEPNRKEQMEMLQAIIQECIDQNITDYADLMRRYRDSYEYLNIISIKGYALKQLTDSLWKQAHPDYVKTINARIIGQE